MSTNGTALYAYARGVTTASTNVNSVAFTAVTGNSAWGNVIFNASFTANTAFAYASNAVPFSGLSSAYKTVLQGGAYGGATTGTVTLGGLVFGRSYSVQIWVDDSRPTGSGRSQSVSRLGRHGQRHESDRRLDLFFADLSLVDTTTLNSFSVNRTTIAAVPEPVNGAPGIFAMRMIGTGAWRVYCGSRKTAQPSV